MRISELSPFLARVSARRRAAASALAPLRNIISLSNASDFKDQPSPSGSTEIIRFIRGTPIDVPSDSPRRCRGEDGDATGADRSREFFVHLYPPAEKRPES